MSVIQIYYSKSYQIVLFELVMISDLYLFISSSPSLKIDNEITTTNGVIAEMGLKGEIDGNDYKIATNKKYTLE